MWARLWRWGGINSDDLTAQRNEGVYVNGYLLGAEVGWVGFARSALGGVGRGCLCA